MPSATQELQQMKANLDKAKLEKASLEGRKTEIMNRLSKNHNLNTLEEALTFCTNLEKEITDRKTKQGERMQSLRESISKYQN